MPKISKEHPMVDELLDKHLNESNPFRQIITTLSDDTEKWTQFVRWLKKNPNYYKPYKLGLDTGSMDILMMMNKKDKKGLQILFDAFLEDNK